MAAQSEESKSEALRLLVIYLSPLVGLIGLIVISGLPGLIVALSFLATSAVVTLTFPMSRRLRVLFALLLALLVVIIGALVVAELVST